jgi:hypothetical protein
MLEASLSSVRQSLFSRFFLGQTVIEHRHLSNAFLRFPSPPRSDRASMVQAASRFPSLVALQLIEL